MAAKKTKTIHVQQFKSAIGYNKKQREVLLGLGIRRMNQIVELPDNGATRGMIAKIPHLVRIVNPEDAAGGSK